ncbi:sialidase family protein [Methylomonas sp. EFPC3]|uniref:sialidase family protein n=1 Tax=Methylomonas sp. EFPC3 TaxID=3021710 RepID=UPI002417AB72|nr:sialidase family protein [Methylomonas sp. EFPC3]WFP49745.1 sialidase family protein [Methylomonas sp. EFPC3]
MKISKLFLALITPFVVSACATDAVPVDQNPAAAQQGAVNQADCTKAQALPQRGCSDTVTASFDSNGTLWIAWVQQQHIYLQTSDDGGRSFSKPVRVNADAEAIAAHGEYRPKIKIGPEGNVYLTWTQSLEKRHTGHIRFSRSTDGGRTFSKPVTVNDNLDVISHRFDALALGKNGEVFIAWLDARDKEKAKAAKQEFNGTAVYYAWSDNGGASFYPNKIVAPHSCECCRLGVEIAPDNRPLVLWRHVYDGNIRDHVLSRFSDWHTPGPVQRVSHENWKIDACPHHGPGLSITDDGTIHAVWFSGAPDNQGLFYAHSLQGAAEFSQPYRLGNPGAKHPQVLALGQRLAVVWSEFDGSKNLVKLIKSDDGGNRWTQPEIAEATPDAADDAFLLSDGDRIYLSWQTAGGYRFREI